MQLVADRFVADDPSCGTCARDLATRGTVWLEVHASGGASDDRRWMRRCDALFHLRHPSMAALIDYGPLGIGRRFEAWNGRAPWAGAPAAGAMIAAEAARFLASNGLSATPGAMRVFVSDEGPVALPGIHDGYPQAGPEPPIDDKSHLPGVQLISRPSIATLSEMLHVVQEQRPRVAGLWGPRGSGVSTGVLTLAREARIQGFVPLAASTLDAVTGDALTGRSLFLISWSGDAEACRALLGAALKAPRAHVCLILSTEEICGIDSLGIERVDADALIRAVRPASEPALRAAHRAAERAGGLPGAFARALWGVRVRAYGAPVRTTFSRVAEQTATYGGAAVADERVRPSEDDLSPAAPASGELAMLRRKVVQAEQLVGAGRHAPGLRLLRQAIGALARRQAWADALEGGLFLTGALLARGRPRDALRALDDLAACAGTARLADAAVLSGHAWIDLARLDEAERVLRAAVIAARRAHEPARLAEVICALARCLFWRAEFEEALSLLDDASGDRLPPEATCRTHCLRSRIAAAQGDSARAYTSLDDARRHLPPTPATAADVHDCAAFVRLVMGDLEGVDDEVERCIAAARAARRPMRVVSAMLVRAEADRRRRLPLSATRRRTLDRLARTATPLLRLRWGLFNALADASANCDVAAVVAASGVKALRVFAPGGIRDGTGIDAVVREMVGILQVCHDAEDELLVLGQVCSRVRQPLHAAAVAFTASSGGQWDCIVSDGPRIESEIARRAIASNIVVGPYRERDRLEAAAPVHYGGEPIAALCARWTPGAGDELSRAAAVLSMAASAAAPLVHAVLDRRSRRAHPAPFELIGATAAIADLRRVVERAAAAPFAVLIEGESGSGKELVARGIHRSGPRRDRPFCTLNCAALPEDLVESELFGHTRGAFTGATADRPGVFEEAHGGTLFLDEVGELSLRAQAKLLRVIQEGELRRIGENMSRRIDVRVVSATNRDLRRETEAGRFRTDLLYRLDVIRITVPPLRERRDDLAALVAHFWNDATQRIGSRATLSAAARAVLGSYDWPGNVREVQNVLAALAVRCPKRGVVPPHALPPHIAAARRPEVWRLDTARRTFEEAFVRAALVRAGGHRSRAADELGLTRQGLNKLMSRLGIE